MAVIRNNILTNASARDKYIQGVKSLKNDFLRQDWPNTYDIFVIWHYNAMMTLTPPNSTSGRNAAHSGPSFLPWHRWMLILLEHHLQRVLNDPNFGLPYWDWGADGELPPDQQLTAQIWADNCMGGSGSPVTNGPFAAGSWQVNIEQGFAPGSITPVLVSTNRGLQRSLGSDVNILPTRADVLAQYTEMNRILSMMLRLGTGILVAFVMNWKVGLMVQSCITVYMSGWEEIWPLQLHPTTQYFI